MPLGSSNYGYSSSTLGRRIGSSDNRWRSSSGISSSGNGSLYISSHALSGLENNVYGTSSHLSSYSPYLPPRTPVSTSSRNIRSTTHVGAISLSPEMSKRDEIIGSLARNSKSFNSHNYLSRDVVSLMTGGESAQSYRPTPRSNVFTSHNLKTRSYTRSLTTDYGSSLSSSYTTSTSLYHTRPIERETTFRNVYRPLVIERPSLTDYIPRPQQERVRVPARPIRRDRPIIKFRERDDLNPTKVRHMLNTWVRGEHIEEDGPDGETIHNKKDSIRSNDSGIGSVRSSRRSRQKSGDFGDLCNSLEDKDSAPITDGNQSKCKNVSLDEGVHVDTEDEYSHSICSSPPICFQEISKSANFIDDVVNAKNDANADVSGKLNDAESQDDSSQGKKRVRINSNKRVVSFHEKETVDKCDKSDVEKLRSNCDSFSSAEDKTMTATICDDLNKEADKNIVDSNAGTEIRSNRKRSSDTLNTVESSGNEHSATECKLSKAVLNESNNSETKRIIKHEILSVEKKAYSNQSGESNIKQNNKFGQLITKASKTETISNVITKIKAEEKSHEREITADKLSNLNETINTTNDKKEVILNTTKKPIGESRSTKSVADSRLPQNAEKRAEKLPEGVTVNKSKVLPQDRIEKSSGKAKLAVNAEVKTIDLNSKTCDIKKYQENDVKQNINTIANGKENINTVVNAKQDINTIANTKQDIHTIVNANKGKTKYLEKKVIASAAVFSKTVVKSKDDSPQSALNEKPKLDTSDSQNHNERLDDNKDINIKAVSNVKEFKSQKPVPITDVDNKLIKSSETSDESQSRLFDNKTTKNAKNGDNLLMNAFSTADENKSKKANHGRRSTTVDLANTNLNDTLHQLQKSSTDGKIPIEKPVKCVISSEAKSDKTSISATVDENSVDIRKTASKVESNAEGPNVCNKTNAAKKVRRLTTIGMPNSELVSTTDPQQLHHLQKSSTTDCSKVGNKELNTPTGKAGKPPIPTPHTKKLSSEDVKKVEGMSDSKCIKDKPARRATTTELSSSSVNEGMYSLQNSTSADSKIISNSLDRPQHTEIGKLLTSTPAQDEIKVSTPKSNNSDVKEIRCSNKIRRFTTSDISIHSSETVLLKLQKSPSAESNNIQKKQDKPEVAKPATMRNDPGTNTTDSKATDCDKTSSSNNVNGNLVKEIVDKTSFPKLKAEKAMPSKGCNKATIAEQTNKCSDVKTGVIKNNLEKCENEIQPQQKTLSEEPISTQSKKVPPIPPRAKINKVIKSENMKESTGSNSELLQTSIISKDQKTTGKALVTSGVENKEVKSNAVNKGILKERDSENNTFKRVAKDDKVPELKCTKDKPKGSEEPIQKQCLKDIEISPTKDKSIPLKKTEENSELQQQSDTLDKRIKSSKTLVNGIGANATEKAPIEIKERKSDEKLDIPKVRKRRGVETAVTSEINKDTVSTRNFSSDKDSLVKNDENNHTHKKCNESSSNPVKPDETRDSGKFEDSQNIIAQEVLVKSQNIPKTETLENKMPETCTETAKTPICQKAMARTINLKEEIKEKSLEDPVPEGKKESSEPATPLKSIRPDQVLAKDNVLLNPEKLKSGDSLISSNESEIKKMKADADCEEKPKKKKKKKIPLGVQESPEKTKVDTPATSNVQETASTKKHVEFAEPTEPVPNALKDGSTKPEIIEKTKISSTPEVNLEDLWFDYSDLTTESTKMVTKWRSIHSQKQLTINDFHLLKVLGRGSYGKVVLAELKKRKQYYAIKCLKKHVVLEDNDVECTMIEKEVLAMGSDHPYLCTLYCTFQSKSQLFFVMEYLSGGDLMFHIQQSGRFDQDRARFYSAEIACALKYLHKHGIIYRDAKLDNICIDSEGHVRLVDFGFCKLRVYRKECLPRNLCGTPDYMAPEIIRGHHYNQSVDWWSFGVLLYEMLIGHSPFNGVDEEELFWSVCNDDVLYPRFVSREAKQILVLLLEKNPEKRLGMPGCDAGDIYGQPFFWPIDWYKVEKKQFEPPFKPKLKSETDVSNFDSDFTMEKAVLTPTDRNILETVDQDQFAGFTYTNPLLLEGINI